ncbi:MAG: helix-turn-helix domain-containing protein [Acidimicrobiia bacterium]
MQGATETRDEELLTVAEVARLLRVAESTVRKWINRDEVPYLTLPGGDYRVPRTELFRGLRGNVDVLQIMQRLRERLQAEPDDAIDAEITAVRAERARRR